MCKGVKQHNNISDFINEYIKDDCVGIGINWRHFGSSNKNEKENIPLTIRFTMCEEYGNWCIKTLFNKDYFIKYDTVHNIYVKDGYFIKSTNGEIINSWCNKNIDFNTIQLNHYKSKTLPEFRYIRKRQRADIKGELNEDIEKSFNDVNKNEIEDLTAYNFYKNLI